MPYNQQPPGYEGAFASNSSNASSQASAPDTVVWEYDYALSVTPGPSCPLFQPPIGGPPFGDPRQTMGYSGVGYSSGVTLQQPRRRVSPAIAVVAVITVVGVVVEAPWATDVLGKSKSEADPTLSATTTNPSDGDTTDPIDDDTTDPTGDDTMQSNDPQDPLGQIDYQTKPVMRQGDTYTPQDTIVQVLEYKAGAHKQVKVANGRDYKDDEAYVGIKTRLTNSRPQRIYPFDYRFYVGGLSPNSLISEAEDSSQGALTSSKYVGVGESIKRWVHFGALDPPNAGRVRLCAHTPGDHYPKEVTCRCGEPIG